MKNSTISLVITSCGRFDLLEKTIASFITTNTYRDLQKIIVIDDSGLANARNDIQKIISNTCNKYKTDIIINAENIGQVRSIDAAYSKVRSEYIFHLEDDWEFYNSGYIEESIQILEQNPWIITVWLRAHNDTNGHPIESINGLPYKLMSLNYCNEWHGFTWNPGLRRLSDYLKIKSFSTGAPSESNAGLYYMRLGYRAAISNKKQGYVRHIGWERSTATIKGTLKG